MVILLLPFSKYLTQSRITPFWTIIVGVFLDFPPPLSTFVPSRLTCFSVNVPVDLSQVMMVATANTLDTISAPLLDRCEVISLSGSIYDHGC